MQNTDATATVIIILWAARWTAAKCTLHVPAVPQRLHAHTNTHTFTHIQKDLNQTQWEIIIHSDKNKKGKCYLHFNQVKNGEKHTELSKVDVQKSLSVVD